MPLDLTDSAAFSSRRGEGKDVFLNYRKETSYVRSEDSRRKWK